MLQSRRRDAAKIVESERAGDLLSILTSGTWPVLD
jgi:hypothetical protein